MNINNIKNNPVAIGVIGLILGIVIGCLLANLCDRRGDWRKDYRGGYEYGMHKEASMPGMMMGDFSAKTGGDLDEVFVQGMIMHHQGAIIMSQKLLETTKRPELIKLGNDIIDAQTKEIEVMKGWQVEWFK